MLVRNERSRLKAICVGGNWHVRAPDGKLINLNNQEGADLVLGLWEYIDTLERREIKKKRRRTKGTTIEIDAAEAMGGRE